jgi:hypothetical protein
MSWQIESITPTAEPVFSCGLVMFLRETPLSHWPAEFTKTVRNNPHLSPSSQVRHPRFLTLAPISYISPLKIGRSLTQFTTYTPNTSARFFGSLRTW